MRSKRLGNGWALFLNEEDFRLLLAMAPDERTELAIRLGGECGLRVSETIDIEPGDIRESSDPDVEHHFLRVRHAKDTTGKRGDEGKFREAFLPSLTEARLREHALRESLAPSDPYFPVCKRTLQSWLKDAGVAAADHSGDDMWRRFSSHDLRRFFATNTLVRYDMNPYVIQEVGGWEDMQSLKPYLDNPTDDIIAAAFADGPLAGYEPAVSVEESEPVVEPAVGD